MMTCYRTAETANFKGEGTCEVCGKHSRLHINTNGKAMCGVCNNNYCDFVDQVNSIIKDMTDNSALAQAVREGMGW